jgi:arylsulfatase
LLIVPCMASAQESLPFPPKASGSKAGPTIAQSVYSP